VLKDGSDAVIRPLSDHDAPLLRRFYECIPETDRWYMRYDPLDPETMRRWFSGMAGGTVHSIVATACDEIVAHASLHMQGHGATRHLGRLWIMVAERFRHKRLGTWMLLDLIRLAMDKGVSDIRSDFVVGVEDAAIDAAFKLDFFKQALLEGYVLDPRGNRRDLLVMVKRIHRGWSDF